ncbi:hypothetical protein HZH66_008181 [Vespula vulgaris]|uniref:Neurotransmitter-gated ion-channel ligand-binding domain-containing protein n=1 Tax=Vespula vulgaris TaxID=7454 RepID=A0A834JWK3_VESVU|nr:hypothetical protein HZH66_008181 [Vespula vulgaris]
MRRKDNVDGECCWFGLTSTFGTNSTKYSLSLRSRKGDEKNQLLITNLWLKLEWNDVNMRWNISDYGGVKDLRIPPHRLWKPDVLMYNSLKKARFNNPVLPIGSSQSQSIFTNVRNIFSQR